VFWPRHVPGGSIQEIEKRFDPIKKADGIWLTKTFKRIFMKRICLLFLLSAIAMSGSAQKGLRISGYSHYIFDYGFSAGSDDNNYYSGKIEHNVQWGAGIEYLINPKYCIGFLYLHESTKAPITWQAGITNPVNSNNADIDIDCFLIGSDGHWSVPYSKVEGFAGLYFGEASLHVNNPATGGQHSASKFSMLARGGVTVWALEKVGINLQMQFLSIIRGTGNDLYFGTYGNNVGLNDYSGIYQFGLGGGITIRLGN
jgi:hypothetical protein